MKLNDYLKYANISHQEFANSIGVSLSALHKWLYGQRFPNRNHLQKVYEETKGEVTANDFLLKHK